jgi:hypothetical protein
MADVNLVKSIYTGSVVTSLGEVAAADNAKVPGSFESSGNAKVGGTATIGSLAGLLLGTAGLVSALNYVPWTTPSYSAGNFTASSSMTWTVESGDVNIYEYTIIDKTMWLNCTIDASTVGGTVDYALRVAIPASKTLAKGFETTALCYNGTAWKLGIVEGGTSGTYVSVYYATSEEDTKWSLSTNGVYIRFCVVLHIN